MEDNIKRLVSELSDIVKKLQLKYPEVETATKSLLTYVQDPNADIKGMEKKVKQLENTLSQINAKRTPVIETIEKIREALRVKKNGRNDGTNSREDKGPPGSPVLTGKGTSVKGQREEKQLSRPPGSPALTGKGTLVKGQGGDQQFSSRPPGSPALPGKVTPMKSQEAENQLSRPPGSPALTGKGTSVKGQGEEKQLSRLPGSPALTGKGTPVKGQGEEKQLSRPPGSPALTGKGTLVKGQGGDQQFSRPPGSPAPTGKGTPVKVQGEETQLSRSTMVQPNEIDQSRNKVTNTAEKEIRRLEAENKYLKKIMDDLHKNIIDGETKQQKEEKLPEDIRNDQSILELHSTAKKVTNKFYELEMELDFIYKRMSQFSPITDGDKENAGQSPSNKVTVPGREPKLSPTTTKAPSERAMKLDKDLERVSLAWTTMKEKERDAENRIRETVFLQSLIDSLHKELQDLSTDENRNDSSSPLDQAESHISKDSSTYQSLTKARNISNIHVERKRLAEYSTRLLEELSNFSHTRNESNSIVLSEPPNVTSQNVDKKNLKKTETLREKSEQSAFNEKLKRNYENACHIHSQMKEKEDLRVSLEARIGQLEVSNKRLNDIQDQNIDLQKEAESLRLRLSELSGAKLRHENPNITDLSDPNRPTKLGEKYLEIYDNQWTDAFEALSKQTPEHTEDERILYLYNILIDGYHFCKDVRQTQILSLEEIMLYPTGLRGMETRGKRQKEEVSEIFAKNLNDAAKLSSNLSSESMVRAFLTSKEKKSKYGEDMKLCEAYIKECIRICWNLQVHTPPLCLDLKTLKGQKFVKDTYKEYSAKGKKIAFIVWPALFLHENGPLIVRGVAQGI